MNKKTTTKEQKSQDKKLLYATIALVVVIIASCLSLMFINNSSQDKTNVSNNSDTSSSIAQYDEYKTVGSDDVFGLLSDIDGSIIYVGRDTCPHCAEFAPKLIEAIQKEDVLVYYYNTAEARTENADKLNELMDKLDIKSVPALIKIEHGEVVARLDDYDSEEMIVEFLRNNRNN